MLHSLTAPHPLEAQRFLERHHRAGFLLSLTGHGEVLYVGRARSESQPAPLMVLLKPDSSVQVHTASGLRPQNWQPRTDTLTFTLEDDVLILRAARRSPPEELSVLLSAVFAVQALEPHGALSYALRGSEAEIRAALRREPQQLEAGLTVLDEELPSLAGAFDLYARDAAGRFVIVELKRSKATVDAVYQLERYVRLTAAELGASVRGVLAAPALTHPARLAPLHLGLEFVPLGSLSALEGVSAQGALF